MSRTRPCDYCKFDIPFNAEVCGHCGNDIELREVTKRCNEHNVDYLVKQSKKGNVFKDESFENKCPNCLEELIKLYDKFSFKKIELGKLNSKLENHLEKHDILEHNKYLVFIGSAAGALIVGGFLSFVFSVSFIVVALFIYLSFLSFKWLLPYQTYKHLKESIHELEKEKQIIHDMLLDRLERVGINYVSEESLRDWLREQR